MKQMMKLTMSMLLVATLLTACTSDKSEDEPIIPQEEQTPEDTTVEWSGKFEGEWRCLGLPKKGMIVVDGEYMVFDPFPAEAIFNEIIQIKRTSIVGRPERQKRLTDSIGNIFFADSYKYLETRQEISFSLETYPDGSCHTSISALNNMWSEMSIIIFRDKESPYSSETIFINPSDPKTISFNVEADGDTYRVDLVHHEKDVSVDFDPATGLWTFTYRFHEYKIFNLKNGKQYSVRISSDKTSEQNEKGSLQLQFKATQRTGPSDGVIVIYV